MLHFGVKIGEIIRSFRKQIDSEKTREKLGS